MSLFDRGELMTVYPEVVQTDEYGNRIRVPSDQPVQVRGIVQSAGHETLTGRAEDALRGQELETQLRVLCRTFPAGPWSKVVLFDREWDVFGEPRFYRNSVTTGHFTVRLQARRAPIVQGE